MLDIIREIDRKDIFKYYNRLTEVNNEYNEENYMHSVLYSNNGLLLSRLLFLLDIRQIDFNIITGLDKDSVIKEVREFRYVSLDLNSDILAKSIEKSINYEVENHLIDSKFRVNRNDSILEIFLNE